MQGENFVSIIGKIEKVKYGTVGERGNRLFKSRIAIPVDEAQGRYQYIKIAGWNEIADSLNGAGEGSYIKLQGHIEERSYNGKCRHCQGEDRKYWTEVVIDNFVVVED